MFVLSGKLRPLVIMASSVFPYCSIKTSYQNAPHVQNYIKPWQTIWSLQASVMARLWLQFFLATVYYPALHWAKGPFITVNQCLDLWINVRLWDRPPLRWHYHKAAHAVVVRIASGSCVLMCVSGAVQVEVVQSKSPKGGGHEPRCAELC